MDRLSLRQTHLVGREVTVCLRANLSEVERGVIPQTIWTYEQAE